MSNQLIHATSLYLKQHAHNPVNWYPWGEAAFAKAIAEDKPILISIGYAACHWCHVMERESFEDESIAQYMNEHFVCIKVDREEHPAVDHLYMDALHAMNQQGGWPLNVFTTPDKKPFYGGTYFPPKPLYGRNSWREVLEGINQLWQEKRENIIHQATQLEKHLIQINTTETIPLSQEPFNVALAIENLMKKADTQYGGFGRAPKFPSTMAIRFLLSCTEDKEAVSHGLFSLKQMLRSGIYDQVGGGLCRYATDDAWMVPHFEKMLYDNALLLLALADAYSITQEDFFKIKIEEIIDFVYRELYHDGLFMNAIDADSEGVEGKFYTWTWQELNEIIPGELRIFYSYFNIQESGNWEGVNILHNTIEDEIFSTQNNLFSDIFFEKKKEFLDILFHKRKERIRPATDDKMMLSWNALMNYALSKCYGSTGHELYLSKAINHHARMMEVFYQNDNLLRIKGTVDIPAHADDWAYFIQATAQLGTATLDSSYWLMALAIMKRYDASFSDEKSLYYYFSVQDATDILVRKIELYDGALPSVNAIMCDNLWMLGMVHDLPDYLERSWVMSQHMQAQAMKYPDSFGYWSLVHGLWSSRKAHVVCSNKMPTLANIDAIRNRVSVYDIVAYYDLPIGQDKVPKEGMVTVYSCNSYGCDAPFIIT